MVNKFQGQDHERGASIQARDFMRHLTHRTVKAVLVKSLYRHVVPQPNVPATPTTGSMPTRTMVVGPAVATVVLVQVV